MSVSSQELFNLLIRPPANSVYFVIVVALCFATLILSWAHESRYPDNSLYKRYTLAFIGILLAWLLPLIVAVFSLLSGTPATMLIPPLERFAIVITVCLSLWGLSHPHRGLNFFTLIVVFGAVVGLVITTIQWSEMENSIDFNLSPLGISWSFAHIILVILAVVHVVRFFPKIEDTPLKFVYFFILGIGSTFTLLQTIQGNLIGNDSGAMRMSVVISTALLVMLTHRSIMSDILARLKQSTTEPITLPNKLSMTPDVQPAVSLANRESVLLLRALGIMLDSTPNTLPQAVLKAAVDMLKVDVAVILRLKDANYADVVVAFDSVLERDIAGMSINLDNQPTLVNSIDRKQQRPLLPERNAEELRDLYARLDIETFGPAYFQPLTKESEVISVLLVATPYTKRELIASDESLLKGIAIIAANLLQLSYATQDAKLMAEENAIQQMVARALTMQPKEDLHKQAMEAQLTQARDQITALNAEVAQLKQSVNAEQKRVVDDLGDSQEALSVSQKMLALNVANEALRQERDELLHKLQHAETALHGALNTSDESRYNDYIESLKREKASLEAQRIALQVQLDDLRANDRMMMPTDFKELIDRMILERDTLQKERDSLELRLNAVNAQLSDIGIEQGADGLVKLVAQLTDQRSELQNQNNILQVNLAALLAERERLKTLHETEAERDIRLQALEAEVQNLANDREVAIRQRDTIRAEFEGVKQNLRVFKKKWAQLQAQAEAYAKELHALRNNLPMNTQQLHISQTISDESKYVNDNADLLLGLVQELRTPMTSITGYVDLLLSEASGILGEMQRKFLQRVATNVNRLGMMLDDLIQITQLDTGHLSFTPTTLNLANLIEDLISNTTLHFKEKGLMVNLNISDNLPDVQADKDAIEQILMQLLNNAFLVSPINSQIGIRATKRQLTLSKGEKASCLLITVDDKGGGIHEEDIPRVFARKYKAKNPLIQGLGDTGVGLSLAKALVEAQGGKLWVETRLGIGSSFNVLLPLDGIVLSEDDYGA